MSPYLQGFIHRRRLFGILAINSSTWNTGVGRQAFPIGKINFHGPTLVSTQERLTYSPCQIVKFGESLFRPSWRNIPLKFHPKTSQKKTMHHAPLKISYVPFPPKKGPCQKESSSEATKHPIFRKTFVRFCKRVNRLDFTTDLRSHINRTWMSRWVCQV